MLKLLTTLLVLVIASFGATADESAELYFVSPAAGAVVTNPVTVVFGLRGFGVAPAGVVKDNTGHHHLLIDTELADATAPIPNDAQHRHFGGGQTETTIELSPGQHTLQLVLGNFAHIPHNPPIVSEQITITVE
tara:strand:- start:65 stop:466 length:402 start_codon:yes stop_codon:yes gene_type:complete